MLYELYIEGQKADLTEDIEIPFTYTAIDTDQPEAEHGSFSKSVDLEGTETNNNIFGQLYELSRTILLDDDKASIGAYFDPRKRTNYTLWYNGDIVEKGYLKVDNVTKENGKITYSCTLFSDLGDFFYNLMYDKDTGDELTLADLHYGFVDEDDNPIDEDDTLLYWDKDYIYESWFRLRNPIEAGDRSLYSCITAAPTYGGYYDDFDCSKVLVNYASLPNQAQTVRDLLAPVTTSPQWTNSGYTDYKGWMLCEATRDLDEWEVRDIRSVNQRPCIKMSTILDAISDPQNNGGYKVVWDDEIKNSPYYTDTYLMMNRLDFDLDENANKTKELGPLNISTSTIPNPLITTTMYDLDDPSVSVFDLSDINLPHLSMEIGTSLDFSGVEANLRPKEGDHLATCFSGFILYNSKKIMGGRYGGMAMRVDVMSGSTKIGGTPTYFYTTQLAGFGKYYEGWEERLKSQLGLDNSESLVMKEDQIVYDNNINRFKWATPISLDIDLPAAEGISIKIETSWGCVNQNETLPWAIAKVNYNAGFVIPTLYPQATADSEPVASIYDGTINPNLQKTNVTKQILFGESESPYTYLVGFTRMMGAKYIYDLSEKKIYIKARKNYYLPEGHRIDNYIDRGQTINIEPTLTENKWYKYGFETPESYAQKLYKKKNKYDYGVAKVNTGYYFNNEEHDCFDDIPYTNGIPFVQKSLYYGVYLNVPSIFVSPTLDVSIYKKSGDTVNAETIKIKGYGSFYYTPVLKDSTGDKICAFDDKNDPVDDLTNCLVFFNGLKDTLDWYTLSDNIPIMQTLNDENPCYMYVDYGHRAYPSDETDAQQDYVCKWIAQVPVFTKYKTDESGVYTDSLDFIKPNYTFIYNDANYQDGICLYDRYWKQYIQDVYDPDNRAVTVHMFLREKPDTAMRKFYYFDNTVWVISEITDYSASSDKPTEVKFVKCYDTDNYINEPIVWNTAIYNNI